jgi:putative glutamine amidotransferase
MYRSVILFILSFFLFISCQQEPKKPLTIAISKAKPIEFYGNYSNWLKKGAPDAKIINMYELGVDSALSALEDCDGLIIAGGADIYPEWYGQIEDTALCGAFDRYRDTLEIALIKKAIAYKMPLVGICRGEQILNVTLGGSLIVDIPAQHDTLIKHRQMDWQNCYHKVNLVENSYLSSIVRQESGMVNSNHHQAIDRLSDQLKITSRAEDGIIESVEWKEKSMDKGFLIAVQWHPERLDTVHPQMSLPILYAFLKEAKAYQFPQ